jgi:putative transposase
VDDEPKTQHWPHAPPHWNSEAGTYFITASTFHRTPVFNTPELLSLLQDHLLSSVASSGWKMQAWVVLQNHYHLLASSADEQNPCLGSWLKDLHRASAIAVNQLTKNTGRRVWMNYRETKITHQTSFLARMNYIHQNPVRHGIVSTPDAYPWSSYRWFSSNALPAFVESVNRFKTDKLNIRDDF